MISTVPVANGRQEVVSGAQGGDEQTLYKDIFRVSIQSAVSIGFAPAS